MASEVLLKCLVGRLDNDEVPCPVAKKLFQSGVDGVRFSLESPSPLTEHNQTKTSSEHNQNEDDGHQNANVLLSSGITSVLTQAGTGDKIDCLDRLFLVKSSIDVSSPELQTFRQWKAFVGNRYPGRHRLIWKREPLITLLPLGPYSQGTPCVASTVNPFKMLTIFNVVSDFLEIYFPRFRCTVRDEVSVIADVTAADGGGGPQSRSARFQTRNHGATSRPQVHMDDCLNYLRRNHAWNSMFIVGISWMDLYPSESEQFILGQSQYVNRCSVVCFGRFDPNEDSSEDAGVNPQISDLIWRLLKVVTHEVCHLFGLTHCIFYECSMNASRLMREAMQQPIFLCPVCLRKVYTLCHRFDIRQRYSQLRKFFQKLVAYGVKSGHVLTSIKWLDDCITVLDQEIS